MFRSFSYRGFSLVELMVSITLLALISLLLAAIVNSTTKTTQYTTGKLEQFRNARNAFDFMTRRLSQATLNTYLDYNYPNNNSSLVPSNYTRQSDLRLLSGNAGSFLGSSAKRPTHAIFFQAPLGYVDDTSSFGGLQSLINTCGYYVEFNKDTKADFLGALKNPPQDRYRYRLMEFLEPANKLTLYGFTSGNKSYSGRDWFLQKMNLSSPPVHVLSENIIALILLPKMAASQDSTGVKLAPSYLYDSSATSSSDPAINSKNQMPPMLMVTLVAIDEVSAKRLTSGNSPPGFDSVLETLFADASQYSSDMNTLQTTLINQRVNFRVFTTNISLRSSRWTPN